MGAANSLRLPNNTQRMTIVGRTGSGKTQFGIWTLSKAPFDRQPYVMVDYKGDDLIGSIERAKEIALGEVPKHPGLYVVRPLPTQEEEVDAWLWKIWHNERVGLYVDEGYMLPAKGNAMRTILVTGRSKQIPVTILSQRPLFLPRHVFTEANFHAVFHLNDRDDVTTVKRYFHSDIDLHERLPDYHSRYYDVDSDNAFTLAPVPPRDILLERIHDRLKPPRKLL